MTFLSRLLGRRSAAKAPVPAAIAQPAAAAPERSADPWFWSHYEGAAGIVLDLVPADCLAKGRTAVDFGCGDGATTLGVASHAEADVIGLDLYLTFLQLPDLAQKNLGIRSVSASGFEIAATRLIEAEGVVPDARLLEKYPRELLLTNQIVLTARRGAAAPNTVDDALRLVGLNQP